MSIPCLTKTTKMQTAEEGIAFIVNSLVTNLFTCQFYNESLLMAFILLVFFTQSLLETTFSPRRIIWLWYKLTQKYLCKQDFVLDVNNIYQRRSGAVFLSSAQA